MGDRIPGAYLKAQRVALSPDGKVLVSAAAVGNIILTEVETGKEIGRLRWKPAAPFPGAEVLAVAFSPDGKQIAVGTSESASKRPRVENPLGPLDPEAPLGFDLPASRIRIFDVDTAKQVLELAGPRGGASHIAFAEEFIAAGGNDFQVHLFNAKGRELHRLNVTPPGALDEGINAGAFDVVQALRFSADAKSLLCRSSGAIRIWNTTTGELQKTLVRPLDEELIAAAFSPDGKLLAGSGGMEGNMLAPRVTLWETAAGKEVCQLNVGDAHIMLIAFSADSKTVVTTGDDYLVRFWDSATGREKGKSLSLAAEAADLSWSKDGKTLAVAAESVRVYDSETGKDRWAGAGHSDVIDGIVWSPKGDWLASAGHDGLLCVWNPGEAAPKTRLALGGGSIAGIALSADGKTLACGCGDGAVRLINTSTWKVTDKLKEGKGGITGVSFAPDGAKLLAAAVDGQARLWDVAAKKVVQSFEAKLEGIDPMGGVVVNPRGRAMRPPSDGRAVTSALISPDGDTVVTVHRHQFLHFWRASSGKPTRQLVTHGMASAIAFAPGGGLLAIGESVLGPFYVDGGIMPVGPGVGRNLPMIPPGPGDTRPLRLWDMGREKEVLQLPWYEEDPGPRSVTAVAFSPDRRFIAAGDDDGKIFLYELASGRFYRSFKGHHGAIYALAFSPDGRQLVSGSADASLLVWPVELSPDLKKGETLENLWRDMGVPEATRRTPRPRRLGITPRPWSSCVRS